MGILRTAEALTVVAIAAGVLAGCGSDGIVTISVTTTSTTTLTVTTTALPAPGTRDSPPAITVSSAPMATTTSGALGGRTNPVPVGTPAKVDAWTVTLDPTNLDASETVNAENQFNDPPAAGRAFVMVKATVSYSGSNPQRPASDLRIQFVGSGGNTFGSGMNDRCGVIPDPLDDVGEMFDGATAGGNVCVSAASEEIDGGSWYMRTYMGGQDPVFFATR